MEFTFRRFIARLTDAKEPYDNAVACCGASTKCASYLEDEWFPSAESGLIPPGSCDPILRTW